MLKNMVHKSLLKSWEKVHASSLALQSAVLFCELQFLTLSYIQSTCSQAWVSTELIIMDLVSEEPSYTYMQESGKHLAPPQKKTTVDNILNHLSGELIILRGFHPERKL